MKSRITTLALLSMLSFAAVSCDGGSSSTDATASGSTAASLESYELRTGDNIVYQTSTNLTPQLDTLELDSSGFATLGTSRYRYTKTGDRLFTIERISASDPAATLQSALRNTLAGQTTEAPLASRLRALLLLDSASLTTAELSEIASILNPYGANLALASDGALVSFSAGTHTHLVTSTVGDRNIGSMGGTYQFATPSFDIKFRPATEVEKALYRFVGDDISIPYVSENDFRPNEVVESGTWTLELSNAIF